MCKGWPADVYRGEMIMVHEFGPAFMGTDLDHTKPTSSWWAGYGSDGDLMTKMTEAYDSQVSKPAVRGGRRGADNTGYAILTR